ncbi:MAG: hypothetical protein AAF429_15360 [Pseudomonadota bacterium]
MQKSEDHIFYAGDIVTEEGAIFQEIGQNGLGVERYICLEKGAALPITSHPTHVWKERDLRFLQSGLR